MREAEQQKEALKLLSTYWGHESFREGQWGVIEQILAGRDVLAIMPTGGGKSVCYQVPTLMREGVTLVVSPLIALMQDQVQRLTQNGIAAICINSTLSSREIDQIWTDIEFGRYRLVYVAPERLHNETFLARAGRLNIQMVAIDEAHCISEWGMNFRPSYLRIAELRTHLNENIPFVAFTATAPPPIRDDIRKYLELKNPFVYVKGFDRPNLIWTVFSTENKRAKVQDVLKGVPGAGIVYASTRGRVEAWANWLCDAGYKAAMYHGGLSASRREEEARSWITGEKRVIVATNAFGMGIDKADVRFVIHADMPGALEAYYQEAGRAGLDGRRSYAILLHKADDEEIQRGLIADAHPEEKILQAVYDAVCDEARLSVGDHPEVPITVHAASIASATGQREKVVRAAIELMSRHSVWSYVPVMRQRAQVRFSQPPQIIRQYARKLNNRELADFIEVLLRTVHGDAFSDWWEVHLPQLERKAGVDRDRLYKAFDFLQDRELMKWFPPGDQQRLFLLEPRTKRLVIDYSHNRKAKKRALMRLKDMNRYIHSVSCRRHFLLKYFGEASPERCGACDVCLGRHEEVIITPDDESNLRRLLRFIDEEVPAEVWGNETGVKKWKLDGMLRWLLQEEYIVWDLDEDGYALTEKARYFLEEWDPA